MQHEFNLKIQFLTAQWIHHSVLWNQSVNATYKYTPWADIWFLDVKVGDTYSSH